MNTPSDDNIYPVGSTIYAKANPSLKLVIASYYQRMYYCAIADKPNQKHLAYFERELIGPDSVANQAAKK